MCFFEMKCSSYSSNWIIVSLFFILEMLVIECIRAVSWVVCQQPSTSLWRLRMLSCWPWEQSCGGPYASGLSPLWLSNKHTLPPGSAPDYSAWSFAPMVQLYSRVLSIIRDGKSNDITHCAFSKAFESRGVKWSMIICLSRSFQVPRGWGIPLYSWK